jgi:hypothetical protein
MGDILADYLHVQEQVIGQRTRDSPTDDKQWMTGVRKQLTDCVEGFGFDLTRRMANVLDYCVGKSFQSMAIRGLLR